jgi:hypothetical protein
MTAHLRVINDIDPRAMGHDLGDVHGRQQRCGWPDSDDTPPQYFDWQDRNDANAMNRYCLDRHQARINAAFLDYHVSMVGLKELFTVTWHKGLNRAGPWTKAGGVQPGDWPEWMRSFKDY